MEAVWKGIRVKEVKEGPVGIRKDKWRKGTDPKHAAQ